MQTIAQAWLVLHLTNSGVALGITAALRFLPMLLFGAWGGVIADRVDRRKALVATQVASGLLSGGMGAITLSGQATTWLVFVFAIALGCVQVIDTPARQAFASELVGQRLVANAVSLNAAVFTSARVIGPGVAGLLIALLGTGWCFVAFAGALLAANRARPTLRLLIGASLGFGAMLLLAAGMPVLALEMVALVPLGAAMTLFQATTNSLLQLASRPELRGRVMALYMVMFMGTTPIGGPVVGWVAQTLGARAGLAIGGVAAIVTAVVVLLWLRRPAAPVPVPVEEP